MALVRRLNLARPPAAMAGHARVKQIPRILLQAATPYLSAGGDFLGGDTLDLNNARDCKVNRVG